MNELKEVLNLDHLEVLANAATPGPWFVQHGDDARFMNMTAIATKDRGLRHLGQIADDSGLVAVTFHQGLPVVAVDLDDCGAANSAFIAAANPAAVLALIALARSATYRFNIAECLEAVAKSWDGCNYDDVGGFTDVGKSLRREFSKLELHQLRNQVEAECRDDGRCQYAIDHGAEGLGHCPTGKCCMPASSDSPAATPGA